MNRAFLLLASSVKVAAAAAVEVAHVLIDVADMSREDDEEERKNCMSDF